MKPTKIIRTHSLFAAAFAFTVSLLYAQEPSRTIEQIYQFDERGDAKVEFHFQLDRGSWDYWKSEYGDHPDLLLRMTKHDMAAAVIEDFALEKDDVHRSAVSRFKARALAQYRGNGQFEIVVPKNMKLVTGSGTEWAFTNSAVERTAAGNRIVNTTYRAKLPAKAQNAHMVNGSDFDRLAYSLEVTPAKPKTLLFAGIILLLTAIVLGVVGFRASAGSRVSPPLPPATPATTPTALPPR
jgi:hypothetical protein